MFIIRLYNTSDIPMDAAVACPADLSSRRVGKRKDMPTPIREAANVLRIYNRKDNWFHGGIAILLTLKHGIHNQNKYKDRSNPFQCLNKDIPENGEYRYSRREEYSGNNAYDQPCCICSIRGICLIREMIIEFINVS